MSPPLGYCGFDEFENTTVALLAVSGGPFPSPAPNHLRDVCRSLHAWVLPAQVAVPQAHTTFDETGITEEGLRERIWELGEHAAEYTGIESSVVQPAQCQIAGSNS